GRLGHPDEHPGADGTGDSQHRARHWSDLTGAVLHDGPDGARDHLHDPALAGIRVPDALDSRGGHRTESEGGHRLRARVRASPAGRGTLVIGRFRPGDSDPNEPWTRVPE